ncbi:MAG: FmdB family zinc ribbon protein [Candidatus Acidiferrum sp.]
MPLYEYKCLKCGRHTDKIEPVAGPHLKKCPHCGGKVESVITAPAIKFKGSGWYVTDYAGKSPDGGSKEKPASDGKDSGSSDAAAKEPKDGGSKEAGGKDSSPKETSSKESSSKEKKPAKKK